MNQDNTQQESGIETLRALVNMAGWSGEWALDDLNVTQTIKLLQACRVMDLETLPDQLNDNERRYAARTGKLSRTTMRRLYKVEYGSAKHFDGSNDDLRTRGE